MSEKRTSIVWALLAAALYAISSPVSKLLLQEVEPTMMAALLYLGAGLGMLLLGIVRRRLGLGASEQRLTRRDLPYTVGMIVLDVAAPICLMIGLTSTTSANASLLNNFEIVATSLIALLVFREAISRRLWLAIGLITLSSLILSLEDASSLGFSSGSLLVLAACVCWGFENNCTRMMSQSDPLEIVVLKGFGSGLGSLAIALAVGESLPAPPPPRSERSCWDFSPMASASFSTSMPSDSWGCKDQRPLCYRSVHRRRAVTRAVSHLAGALVLGRAGNHGGGSASRGGVRAGATRCSHRVAPPTPKPWLNSSPIAQSPRRACILRIILNALWQQSYQELARRSALAIAFALLHLNTKGPHPTPRKNSSS